MLQYKIPQNVQVEDKIVSFLTLRQLVICAIGGGLAYIIYMSLSSRYYWEVYLFPVAVVSGLTLAIAFLRINDIPFTKWFLLIVEFFMRPRKRVWDKSANTGLLFAFVSSKRSGSKTKEQRDKIAKKEDAAKQKDLSTLDEITKKLDRNPFDHIKSNHDIDKSPDDKLAQAALMSESAIDRHESRIEELIAAQKKKKETLKTNEEKINQIKKNNFTPVVNQDKSNVEPIIANKKEVMQKSEVEEKEVLPQIKKPEKENIEIKPPNIDSDNHEEITQTKAEPININIEEEKSKEIPVIKKDESTKQKLEAQKIVTKEEFLKSKQKKKFSRKAFPLPSIKKEAKSNDINVASYPKRFTPVREKKHIDTRQKPVVPEEHEILLSQAKEGEIPINFFQKK